MSEPLTVPVRVRVHLAHATVQAIADEADADILHIKGPAVDRSLRPTERLSVDADVLVRPSHLKRFLKGLKRHGWQQVTTLRSGGLVEHSTNWFHGALGQMDVHVRFPGIQAEAERAFERLWWNRSTLEIAQRPCVVPSLAAQRLILLLHAARDLNSYSAEVRDAWDRSTQGERDEVLTLAGDLGAEVALAAATGRLEDFGDRPEYGLWRLYADGTITTAGLGKVVAEIKAAPEGIRWPRSRVVGYVVHILVFMPRRLETLSGRKPTLREIGTAYRVFLRRGSDAFKVRSSPSRRH